MCEIGLGRKGYRLRCYGLSRAACCEDRVRGANWVAFCGAFCVAGHPIKKQAANLEARNEQGSGDRWFRLYWESLHSAIAGGGVRGADDGAQPEPRGGRAGDAASRRDGGGESPDVCGGGPGEGLGVERGGGGMRVCPPRGVTISSGRAEA